MRAIASVALEPCIGCNMPRSIYPVEGTTVPGSVIVVADEAPCGAGSVATAVHPVALYQMAVLPPAIGKRRTKVRSSAARPWSTRRHESCLWEHISQICTGVCDVLSLLRGRSSTVVAPCALLCRGAWARGYIFGKVRDGGVLVVFGRKKSLRVFPYVHGDDAFTSYGLFSSMEMLVGLPWHVSNDGNPVRIFFILLTAIPSVIKYVMTPELYATKYRAVGMGSASVWTRVGGKR